ncbi:MAG TPA: hypothetical protein VFJ48_07780 [Casimicrobiaceae bacterium]|nr:hypothetical protein [Casimicrobiaceae bacterium]
MKHGDESCRSHRRAASSLRKQPTAMRDDGHGHLSLAHAAQSVRGRETWITEQDHGIIVVENAMSLFSKISRFWSGRLTAAAAGRQLAERLRSLTPDLEWLLDDRQAEALSLELPRRMIVMLEDRPGGIEARVVEPGQPGDDDPPMLLRAEYDVINLAHSLSWRARVAPGTVALHALRANAVYEVARPFADHTGRPFAVGTRLTFMERRFLPYHGGHTLCFREATIYLHEDGEVCRAFGHYFVFARPQ